LKPGSSHHSLSNFCQSPPCSRYAVWSSGAVSFRSSLRRLKVFRTQQFIMEIAKSEIWCTAKPVESNPPPNYLSFIIILYLLLPKPIKCSLSFMFSDYNSIHISHNTMRATYVSHLLLIDIITLKAQGENTVHTNVKYNFTDSIF
jgi:hypothetical protein